MATTIPSPVSVPLSIPITQNPIAGGTATSGGDSVAFGSNNIGELAGAGSSTGASSIVQYLIYGLLALAAYEFLKGKK
jgi:hypothetical protein